MGTELGSENVVDEHGEPCAQAQNRRGGLVPNVVALACCNFEVQCGALKGKIL